MKYNYKCSSCNTQHPSYEPFEVIIDEEMKQDIIDNPFKTTLAEYDKTINDITTTEKEYKQIVKSHNLEQLKLKKSKQNQYSLQKELNEAFFLVAMVSIWDSKRNPIKHKKFHCKAYKYIVEDLQRPNYNFRYIECPTCKNKGYIKD